MQPNDSNPTDPKPETFKPCDAQDLTAMTLPQIIAFAIEALNDAPVACFVQGLWMDNEGEEDTDLHGWARLFDCADKNPEPLDYWAPGTRDRVAFKPGLKNPETVRYCAVGAVLARDGARAAFDWVTSGATHRWAAGYEAGMLFSSLSDLFETAKISAATAWTSDTERALKPVLMAAKVGVCIAFLKRIARRLEDGETLRDFLAEENEAACDAMREALREARLAFTFTNPTAPTPGEVM